MTYDGLRPLRHNSRSLGRVQDSSDNALERQLGRNAVPDFIQPGQITTVHDFGTTSPGQLRDLLTPHVEHRPIGLVLPITASDMRAAPFDQIVKRLAETDFLAEIVIALGLAPDRSDYQETLQRIAPLGDRARVLWTDGPRVQQIYQELSDAGFRLGGGGKGRAVWTAFGYLLSNPKLHVYALHDCDIVDYDWTLLARLCLPLVHSSFDYEFCKAYYARYTDRFHGRVVRLLVAPLMRSMASVIGQNSFLDYLSSFRYPLAGEFAVTSSLARTNRIPSDWGLEVGTLAEVFRNTSVKRVCQVDICHRYEHKHQDLSREDPTKGLMKMATDILTTLFRTLASMGQVMHMEHFAALRSAYLRVAQNSIRQYHADATLNGLALDRHGEERAVEGFAQQIGVAGENFLADPLGGEAIANWSRVLAARPSCPNELRAAAEEDLI